MPPRDLASLLDFLIRNRTLVAMAGNLLAQWGPSGRRLLGPDFLPPRFLPDGENMGEIERVHYFTVAAKDKSRHSPAPKVDGGNMFGTVRYKVGDSGLIREMTSRDYDALMRYLRQNAGMSAIGVVEGFADRAILQALVERDEFKTWQILTTGGYGRYGDNGYVELVDGPNLSGQFIDAGDDWSDPETDPYVVIAARIQRLVNLGYAKNGIRVVTTDETRTILKSNPYSALRSGKSRLVTQGDGTIITEPINGIVEDSDIDAIFRGLGVQAPTIYDLRGFTPGHVQKRFYPEGSMSFIASTGISEEVRWNQDDPEDITVVNDVVGFFGIGTANGQQRAGRQIEMRAFTRQTDARLEGEGWQATDGVLMIPEAVCGLNGIQ
jgi:hypothetical protein